MRGMEGQNLVVCGGHDTVCAWASNSSDFCSLAGFHLEGLDTRFGNGAQMVCYDAKLETVTALSGTNLGEGLTRTFPQVHANIL